MAEIKTGIFAKNVQKRLNRAQEKVLQKLGKADETKDEQFEQVVVNFKRQESEGSRLQREMKAYMAAIKGMQQASINLSESLHEVYEPDWYGKDDVMVIGKDSDALWEDFHNKLVDSTLLNLDGYLQQFPDLKTRVAKRSRKLIDYDSARHHMETLQASGIRNDRKMMKAEEELKKAQKVFDELNVGLQDELPTLWDSRVGFYVSTFKNVTNLEAKFHREISLLCKQLYEVMTKLGEQHSDKMFTIQGAPSDSGPLRLARTPSPPDDDSPPTSPEAGSNHMLRPASPGPPRPKSPNQLKKGPPVPPPPKATPTKEVAQEQIIDLFGGDFLPAPTPSQPNERPGESLLDLDFDAFQPDQSVSPIPQTAVPWDMWSGNEQPVPQAADGAFVADWSADFGSANTNGDGPSAAPDGESAEGDSTEGPAAVPGAGQDAAEACHPADSWAGQEEDPTLAQPLRANEITTAAADEVSGRQLESQTNPNFHFSAVGHNEAERQLEDRCAMGAAVGEGVGARVRGDQAGQEETEGDEAGLGDRRKSTPGLIFTNEHGEQIGSGSEYETAEEWGDVGQGAGWASGDDELTARDNLPVTVAEPTGAATAHQVSIGWAAADAGSAGNDFAADCAQTSAEVQPETVAAERLSETELMENQGLDPCTRETFEREVERDFGSETAGGFSSDPFTQIPSGGIHMDELQGGGGFTSDAFGQTPGGEGFVADFTTDPFGQTPGGEGFVADFTTDPFAQTTHEGGGGAGWDADPFADGFKASFPDPGSASGDPGAWEEVGTTSGSFPEGQGGLTSPASHTGASEEKAKEANPPRVHKEPESSDMSEDEAANRRYGRLYQDLDTEREEDGAASAFFADFDKMNDGGAVVEHADVPETHQVVSEGGEGPSDEPTATGPSDVAELTGDQDGTGEALPAGQTETEEEANVIGAAEAAGTSQAEAETEVVASPKEEASSAATVGSPVELAATVGSPVELAATVGSPVELAATVGSPVELAATEAEITEIPSAEGEKMTSPSETDPLEPALSPEDRTESPLKKMPIPSVVIEPASSNEGDDDRDADIISPSTAISDNGMMPENQVTGASGPVPGLPTGFMYKVETMHDFEAANSDELELKRGDVVLVVPTALLEDQDAGWLTGLKESEWLALGAAAQRGLFPENFTQRME